MSRLLFYPRFQRSLTFLNYSCPGPPLRCSPGLVVAGPSGLNTATHLAVDQGLLAAPKARRDRVASAGRDAYATFAREGSAVFQSLVSRSSFAAGFTPIFAKSACKGFRTKFRSIRITELGTERTADRF
jgi:hypothetical protein